MESGWTQALASGRTQGGEDGAEALAHVVIGGNEGKTGGTDRPAFELQGGLHGDRTCGAEQPLAQGQKLLVEGQGGAGVAAQEGTHHRLDLGARQVAGHTDHAHRANRQHRQGEGVVAAVDGGVPLAAL